MTLFGGVKKSYSNFTPKTELKLLQNKSYQKHITVINVYLLLNFHSKKIILQEYKRRCIFSFLCHADFTNNVLYVRQRHNRLASLIFLKRLHNFDFAGLELHLYLKLQV